VDFAVSKGLTAVLERLQKAAPENWDWPAGAKGELLDMAAEHGQTLSALMLLQ
jgi:hypothetical protein